MEELNQHEQKIFERYEARIDEVRQWEEKKLREELESELVKVQNFKEDWQVHYRVNEIIERLQHVMLYGSLTKEQIKYISSISWTALFFGPLYAFGSKLYLWALGYFVPFFNIYVYFYIIINGRALSYKKGWKSFDEFKKRQWYIVIFIIVTISILTINSAMNLHKERVQSKNTNIAVEISDTWVPFTYPKDNSYILLPNKIDVITENGKTTGYSGKDHLGNNFVFQVFDIDPEMNKNKTPIETLESTVIYLINEKNFIMDDVNYYEGLDQFAEVNLSGYMDNQIYKARITIIKDSMYFLQGTLVSDSQEGFDNYEKFVTSFIYSNK